MKVGLCLSFLLTQTVFAHGLPVKYYWIHFELHALYSICPFPSGSASQRGLALHLKLCQFAQILIGIEVGYFTTVSW